MVSIVTSRLKKRLPLFLGIVFSSTMLVQANVFDDLVKGVKNAANKVDEAFKSAGQEIKKNANIAIDAIKQRFSDTKTTRAIDYGIRKAAFEVALGIANEILEKAQKASTGTLSFAEDTAKLGLTAAEKFLSEVVAAASPKILQGSAAGAKDFLEYVKKIGVGTLEKTQWVVSQATSTFDINRIRYQGDLQRLKGGVLGDMLCEGVAFKKPFSFKFDLDPREGIKGIDKGVAKISKHFETLFNENVADPIKKAFAPLVKQVQQAEKSLANLPKPDPKIQQALEAAQKAANIATELENQGTRAIKLLEETTEKLNNLAKKNNAELETLIKQGISKQQYAQKSAFPGQLDAGDTILARQELVRRLKAGQLPKQGL